MEKFDYFWKSLFTWPLTVHGYSQSFISRFYDFLDGKYAPTRRINYCPGACTIAIDDPRGEVGRFVQRKKEKKVSFVTEKTHYAIR